MNSNTNDDKGLFWNSTGGDRLYDANSMSKFISPFYTSGVMTGDCEVTASGSNMTVSMAPGYVNIANPNAATPGGKVRYFDSATSLTVATSDTYNPRIDTVVLERNDNDREITVSIVTGTAAASPTATAPVRTSGIYQLVLAEIYVGAGVSVITNDNITMKRDDNSVCGLITGTVSNNQIVYSDTDLTAGTSELATGTVYFVYE